ncbi:MAG: peptidase M3 [Christensenellales bacterium]|jgi:M3 family oligoendopeptidase
MHNQRRFCGLLALILALAMALTGCKGAPAASAAPQPSADQASQAPASAEPLPTDDVHGQVAFADMAYRRPDIDGINAKIDQALAWAQEGGKQQETLQLYQEIIDALSDYDTMNTLASIHYDLDLTDADLEAEVTLLEDAWTKLDNRMNQLTGAIMAGEYAEAFEQQWGRAFIDRYEVNNRLNSPQIEPLTEQETELVNAYKKLLVKAYTAEVDGQALTIDQLDLATPEGVAAYYEIYQQRNADMGEIYRQLIAVRAQIAKTLGFDSYTQYAYALLGRDYSPEEAGEFSVKVREVLVPLYEQLSAQFAARIEMTMAASSYRLTLEEALPVLERALKDGYPAQMSQALAYMQQYGLYDFGGGENKMMAGYTTLINDYAAPYMFINANAYADGTTVFHEFGHYYNFYRMGPTVWNDANSLDTAEIHSQGLEVLMYQAYDALYGDKADLYALGGLLGMVNAVLQGCAEDQFQQLVADNPEITLEEMNQLHGDIYQQYMGYPLYYEWVDIHHHFETPFYYISYATSAISALEIWELSTRDRGAALATYDKITQYTINVDYLDALAGAGLSNPFATDCVSRIAEALSAFADRIEPNAAKAAP